MQIKELQIGDSAKIDSFVAGASKYRKHLLALGLTPGVSITLTRRAPLGDPIEIKVRGTSISLRKKEAEIINLIRNVRNFCGK